MNAILHSEHTSRFTSADIRTDRDNEYQAFARTTRQLQCAQSDPSAQARAQAVHLNSQLWSLLANDLAGPENLLPDQIKAGLLSLAIFSIRHGLKVIADSADISALIDVNLAIMRALRGDGGAA